MTFGHLMGIPVEEGALTLAPAGAAIVSGVALFARSKLAGIVGWLRRHYRADTTTHPLLLHARASVAARVPQRTAPDDEQARRSRLLLRDEWSGL